MARKRRQSELFSMSFLDCMCCGFGAVILLFMIINSQIKEQIDFNKTIPESEINSLKIQILQERKNLVLARNLINDIKDEDSTINDELARLVILLNKLKVELEKSDIDSIAKNEEIEKLKADIEKLSQERDRMLTAAQRLKSGDNIRSYTGDGDRQYLTGLKVGGERILILIDASASMLDRKIINILRRRNMSDSMKLRSIKWRQAVSSVDWLIAQFPKNSKFQMYTFNNETRPVLKESDGVWIDVTDSDQLDQAVKNLRRIIPENGTNMKDAFAVIGQLNPRPDNVILLVDGLPTMNQSETDRGMITGQERLNFYYEAESEIPSGVPMNILLYPMEGDYNAAIAYWLLAYRTGGSFMSISKDWP
tara:strand:- start:13604 stop:14698 length:1095 start_codon:yes stop_codon:yes gene_type:complete